MLNGEIVVSSEMVFEIKRYGVVCPICREVAEMDDKRDTIAWCNTCQEMIMIRVDK